MSDRNTFEANILANIEAHGCSINYVFDPDGESPEFAYSIGFPRTVAQPEIIVFGLSRDLMLSMINEVWRQCSAEALKLHDGVRISNLVEEHDCIAREIPESAIDVEHFASALWYRREVMDERMDRAFQLVWPGVDDGLYPWELGADEEVIELQPPLYDLCRVP